MTGRVRHPIYVALQFRAPGAQVQMPKIEIYASMWCGYCARAKALLTRKGVSFIEHDVDTAPALRREMVERGGGYTVPQIFVDDQPIGGCDDIHALDAAGKLDGLLGLAGSASG